MKASNIRLFQEPNNSFIVLKETNPFSKWHHHPEFELVLITKGVGRRIVGDNIDRFVENDLVFMGPYTPHEWLCNPEYFDDAGNFYGEGIVIQFLPDFLGNGFFLIPENLKLKKLLDNSGRGIEILGESKSSIITIMTKMVDMDQTARLYALFSIFEILSSLEQMAFLASTAFVNDYEAAETTPMQKAIQFIVQNFQRQIHTEDLLEITNMSYSSFYVVFKNSFRMTFKEYLLNLRVGYACKLLTHGFHNVNEIAFLCGFENISNFNRQFKKIKGITPSMYSREVIENRPVLYQ